MKEPEQVPPNRPGMTGRLRSLAIDLSPLRESRQFRLLFIGEAVSDLGSEITAVAVPYQVYQITRSPLAVGLLALCQLGPIMVLPIVGGAIADAVERRRLLRIVYAILPLLSLALAWHARLQVPHLWVTSVVGSAA